MPDSGGQLIARSLTQQGVKHLFVLCGGHIAPIYVDAEKAGIRIVDVRDEASAVFAADAMARLTGIPGVVAVTAGPGVTNAITPLKNAQIAQSPLVLLGGATATLLKGRGALQDIDQASLVGPHVKWYGQAKRVSDIPAMLKKGFLIATSGVPGPVFIELPVDLLYPEPIIRDWYVKDMPKGNALPARAIRWYMRRHLKNLFRKVPAQLRPVEKAVFPSHRANDLHFVRRALQNSKKPVIVISSGAMMLPSEVQRISEAVKTLGIPVYLSGMARGLTGKDHPLQYRHQRGRALKEADCILLAGVPCDFRLGYGRKLNRKAVKVTINRDAEALRKNIRPSRAILADPGAFLIELAQLPGQLPGWTEWKDLLTTRENEREQEIDQLAAQPTDFINPLALFRKMEALLPGNSILIADGGDFAASASYTLRPRKPLGWLDPGAFGTLGVGGGFALAAALQYPDDYIWIIYGDGSAAYSLMEMDSFRKYGLKVCAIIGNNGSWEQIARDQVPMLGTSTATDLPYSDYEKVAEAFGGKGRRVDSLNDFEAALSEAKAAMDQGIPFVINAVIGSTGFREGSISM